MAERPHYIGPNDDGKAIEDGTEIIVPATEQTERTVFAISDSDNYDSMLILEEQGVDDNQTKAKAYFRKGKKLTYEMIPDLIKGEEGKRFLKIAGALATAAVGASAYIIIRKKSKK